MLYRLSYMGKIVLPATLPSEASQSLKPNLVTDPSQYLYIRPALNLERVMGIEPTLSAWKAEVLPLNYTRDGMGSATGFPPHSEAFWPAVLVEGGGFEPPKVEPSDLQSDPFGHSGTPPKHKPRIMLETRPRRQPESGMNYACRAIF